MVPPAARAARFKEGCEFRPLRQRQVKHKHRLLSMHNDSTLKGSRKEIGLTLTPTCGAGNMRRLRQDRRMPGHDRHQGQAPIRDRPVLERAQQLNEEVNSRCYEFRNSYWVLSGAALNSPGAILASCSTTSERHSVASVGREPALRAAGFLVFCVDRAVSAGRGGTANGVLVATGHVAKIDPALDVSLIALAT